MATTSDLSFSDIDPDLIEQVEEYLVNFLQEQFPSRDFSDGRVLRELVVNVAADLHAINREDIDGAKAFFVQTAGRGRGSGSTSPRDSAETSAHGTE